MYSEKPIFHPYLVPSFQLFRTSYTFGGTGSLSATPHIKQEAPRGETGFGAGAPMRELHCRIPRTRELEPSRANLHANGNKTGTFVAYVEGTYRSQSGRAVVAHHVPLRYAACLLALCPNESSLPFFFFRASGGKGGGFHKRCAG